MPTLRHQGFSSMSRGSAAQSTPNSPPAFRPLTPAGLRKVMDDAANRMGGSAAREGITFKQTPYALRGIVSRVSCI